jgi:hypothetical protein
MVELVYANKEVEDLVKGKYPDAVITDASDCIHTERFEFEAECEKGEFYIFAIREGFAEACLGFQIMMHDYPKGRHQEIWDWIAEAKALDEIDGLAPQEGR